MRLVADERRPARRQQPDAERKRGAVSRDPRRRMRRPGQRHARARHRLAVAESIGAAAADQEAQLRVLGARDILDERRIGSKQIIARDEPRQIRRRSEIFHRHRLGCRRRRKTSAFIHARPHTQNDP